VQHEDDSLRLALEIVAEEAAGTEVALTLEDHVVDHVVDVDEEAPGREARGEREALGARVDARAGERGGDEMASGADDDRLAQVRVAVPANPDRDRLPRGRQPSEWHAIDQLKQAAPESFHHASWREQLRCQAPRPGSH
jgi:hypothetical protein